MTYPVTDLIAVDGVVDEKLGGGIVHGQTPELRCWDGEVKGKGVSVPSGCIQSSALGIFGCKEVYDFLWGQSSRDVTCILCSSAATSKLL